MLLRKAFKLACNGSNLSKGRAGNSILFESCFLLSKQERGTSKKEKLHSNLASQYTHLVFGVIQSLKKKEGSRNGDLTVDFTSLDEFRVDVEAAGGDITWRGYNLQVLSMVLFEGRYQDSSVPTAHHRSTRLDHPSSLLHANAGHYKTSFPSN